MRPTVGIIGLGLIGGSFAKTLQSKSQARVLGYDIDDAVALSALSDGAIGGILGTSDLADCDYLIIALRPYSALAWMNRYADKLSNHTIIFDVAGVKRTVIENLSPLAASHGLRFVAAHPMAGFHESGYAHSSDRLFEGASFIICEDEHTDSEAVEQLKEFVSGLGFGQVVVTTADNHDEMIAFTSQLAHIVSSAYVKDPDAQLHGGYSAGSFQDMTRVAILDAEMWSELCLENADRLVSHIDILVENLLSYRASLAHGDGEQLTALLQAGVDAKRSSIKAHNEAS